MKPDLFKMRLTLISRFLMHNTFYAFNFGVQPCSIYGPDSAICSASCILTSPIPCALYGQTLEVPRSQSGPISFNKSFAFVRIEGLDENSYLL